MKRGEPFNVLRDRNSWSENPRAEAIAFSLFGGGFATSAAFAASTVGMFAIAGVSVGLSLVTSWAVAALTPMPPTPKQSILVNGRDAAAPQDFIYGTVRKGGTITYYESTRGGSVLHQIIALAGHEVDDIVEVYANDEVLELSNEDYDFNGRTGAGWVLNRNWIDKDDGPELRVLYHTGSQTAITDPFANATTTSLNDTLFEDSDEGSANFGGTGQPTKESFVGTGIAYLYIRYSYNAGVFKNGLPLFTAKIKGRPVYDPRTDTTAWSDNAALCIRDFIANAYGLGDPQVDDTAFGVAANICDETVTLAAGGTEKRYTINGVVRADQSYGDVLQEMTTACAGTLFWGTGKWKLHVGAYSAPVKDFTLNDIRSTSISLQTRVNLRDQFNKVQGVFTDAGSDYIPVDYPPIESATFKAQDNNVEQVLDLDLPFTTSAAAAQRLAKLTLFRGREQMSFTADFGLSAFEVEVGDIISLTMSRYGWEAKEFEVVGWVFGADDAGALRISLTLRETSEAAFDWDAEESDIISNDSDLTSDVNPVTNLTATAGGTIAQDGTFINSILVDWDAANNATGYDIEWMVNTSVDYAANGGIVEPADAVTPREQFIYKAYVEILYRQPDGDGFDFYNTGGGSSLTEEEIRAQLFESSERSALAFSGSSVRNPTTEFTITPVRDETEYNIRVRAFNDLGDQSEWTSVTFTSVTDGTVPNAPTSLTATGGYRTARLAWDAPTQNTNGSDLTDLALYNIYRGLSANPTTKVASTAGEGWTDSGLADSTTYHYRVTAVDFTGNESAYSNNDDTATNATLVDGTDGNTVAVVNAYIRSATAPSTPTGGSFNFDTLTLTPPSGWAAAVPAGTDPVYVSVATASITGTSGTDSALTWSTPSVLAQNGSDGTTGKSVYTAIVFRRSTTAPSAPSGGSFNFGTNVLIPPSGWFLDVPSGTDPIYGTRFVFSITGDTGSQTAGTWATPFRIAEDGADGLDGNDGADGISTYQASIFRRSSSTPSTPTGGSYNFGTNTLTPPSGWSISVPSGTDPLYTSTTLASIQGVSGTDSSLTWTTPVVLARDGETGNTGDRGPGRWYIDIDATVYNLPIAETAADNAWNATTSQHPTRPVVLDQVIFYEGTQSNPTKQQAFICTSVSSDTSHTWNEQEELIDGDLLVTGTITGAKIAGSTITADKLNVTNLADFTNTYQNDSTVLGLTVGTLISAANNGMRTYRYSSSTSGFAFAARNYVGPAGQFQANINNSSGAGDAIVATNGGGAGSTAIDARSTRAGGGHAQIALTVNDGGYGIFLPATSADGGLDASGGGWSPFTGVHMGMLLKTCACVPGDILTDHLIAVKTISDTFGEVRASVSVAQAGAIGVLQKRKSSWILPPAFIDKEATRLAQESAPEGVVVDPILIFDPSIYHDDYDLVDINAVGEGAINVCGENGNISKGDLIVTSSTPGKGMKQADDIVRSYTVAKAREAVTFDSPSDIKMVACIYLCG